MKVLLLFSQIIINSLILVSSQEDGKRLIKTSEDDPGQWMTEDEILELKKINKGFFDITNFNYPDIEPSTTKSGAIPSTLKHTEFVQGLFPSDTIDDYNFWKNRMERFVLHFSSYFNRYYKHDTGRQSQLWLLSQVTELVENYVGKVEVFEVDHKEFMQQSVICRIEGEDETLKDEVAILSAHQDSITYAGLYAPGADDNGSGVIAILEVLQAIVDHNATFHRTLEFHWYAAEEVGLLGSQSIAEDYRERGVNVVGVLNLDVVGHPTPDEKLIAVFTDKTDPDLSQFLKLLAEAHLSYGWKDKECGYACSDHASWTKNGFPAAFASEPKFTINLHYYTDKFCTVDFNQVKEFVKLGIGFAVEMAEPMAA